MMGPVAISREWSCKDSCLGPQHVYMRSFVRRFHLKQIPTLTVKGLAQASKWKAMQFCHRNLPIHLSFIKKNCLFYVVSIYDNTMENIDGILSDVTDPDCWNCHQVLPLLCFKFLACTACCGRWHR